MEIIKRSGRKQRFSSSKIRRGIARSLRDAKIRGRKASRILSEVSRSVERSLRGRRSIKVVEIRRRVLRRLDNVARAAASAWRRFDRRRR